MGVSHRIFPEAGFWIFRDILQDSSIISARIQANDLCGIGWGGVIFIRLYSPLFSYYHTERVRASFDLKKAADIQKALSYRLVLRREVEEIGFVGGADFSYEKKRSLIGAVLVVMTFPGLEVVAIAHEVLPVRIPYIPGYLNFREGPAFFRVFRKIEREPDVTLVDGNGIAHPRRMGLASYVGVVLDIPTIGCAKSPFFRFAPPGRDRGSYTVYTDDNQKKVGFCLRTRTNVRPVFVSPGHRMDFRTAREITLACSRWRIPEPLRRAHQLAKALFS
ncbi:MAG: endonuclease V [Candidatus Aminicenantales bacterium]